MYVRLSVLSTHFTMRLQISILFVLVASSYAYYYNPLDLFDRYQQKFKLKFDGYEKFMEKRENFLENLKKIDAHNFLFNTGKSNFRAGINKFTHYSKKEVSRYLTGLEPKANRDDWEFATEHRNTFGRGFSAPEQFNWNEKGMVTPVQVIFESFYLVKIIFEGILNLLLNFFNNFELY